MLRKILNQFSQETNSNFPIIGDGILEDYLNSIPDFNIDYTFIGDDFSNLSISNYGNSFWHNFRKYLMDTIKKAKSISFDVLDKYFYFEYTFYGASYEKFFQSRAAFGENLYVNIYDPDIDNTGFCDSLNDFSFITKDWILDNSQNMNDQNSYNFQEFVKVLLSLKDGFYKPNFKINRTKIKRGSNFIQTSDGRITIEWSEEVEILSTDYRVYLLFVALLLLTFGVVKPNIIVNIVKIYFPDFVGFFDLCSAIGKSSKMFIRGRTLKKIAGFFSKQARKDKAVKRFLNFFRINMKKRTKDLPLLPASRKSLPSSIRKALPKARDG
jgi:hypothetical protein